MPFAPAPSLSTPPCLLLLRHHLNTRLACAAARGRPIAHVDFDEEVRAVAQNKALFPTKAEFAAAGKLQLYRELQREEGGFGSCALRLGLHYRKGPAGVRYRGPLLSTTLRVRAEITTLQEAGVCEPGASICAPAARQTVLTRRTRRLCAVEEANV